MCLQFPNCFSYIHYEVTGILINGLVFEDSINCRKGTGRGNPAMVSHETIFTVGHTKNVLIFIFRIT